MTRLIPCIRCNVYLWLLQRNRQGPPIPATKPHPDCRGCRPRRACCRGDDKIPRSTVVPRFLRSMHSFTIKDIRASATACQAKRAGKGRMPVRTVVGGSSQNSVSALAACLAAVGKPIPERGNPN